MVNTERLSRRALIRNGTLVLLTSVALPRDCHAEKSRPAMRFGLVTDLHYADKPAVGSRHYRETLGKLSLAAEQLRQEKPEFLVELGDLIDAAESVETELRYLKRVNDDFAAICPHRHYVLGNHCVHTLHKQEFLDGVGQSESYYSFDVGGNHFVVLDSCFRSDGQSYGRKNFVWTDPNIPEDEIEWLKTDLATTGNKTVVLAHQRLDVNTNHGVRNAAQVRDVLEQSGKVQAVFQGHSHKNDYKEINGIHYCTFVAMVEGDGAANSGYSVIEIAADRTIVINGFVKQDSYRWPA